MTVFHYFRGVKEGFIATIGFFDGVHLGHQHLIRQVLEEARRRGLQPLLVTFDRHPREVFAPDEVPTLLTTIEEKKELKIKMLCHKLNIGFRTVKREEYGYKLSYLLHAKRRAHLVAF